MHYESLHLLRLLGNRILLHLVSADLISIYVQIV